MTRKFTTQEFIERAIAIHGNRYDYGEVEYDGSFNKVVIICPRHGPFRQSPVNHIHGKSGCPTCGHGGTTVERFWEYVCKDGTQKSYVDSYCWQWTSVIAQNGYGRFWVNDKSVPAHHFSYELHYGPIPNGLFVLHHCDNPSCVNPDHLFVGTIADNVHDMISKGRNVPTRGQRSSSCKLTPDKVRKIRVSCVSGNYQQKQIAEMFGVSQETICDIVHRRTWAWLDD